MFWREHPRRETVVTKDFQGRKLRDEEVIGLHPAPASTLPPSSPRANGLHICISLDLSSIFAGDAPCINDETVMRLCHCGLHLF